MATVPIGAGTSVGTGFQVAPHLLLTCAHTVDATAVEVRLCSTGFRAAGTATIVAGSHRPDVDLVLLATRDERPYAALAEPVQPADELWAFGYPDGTYRSGEPVVLRAEGPAQRRDGTQLLKATDGRVAPGHSGAPVLNWRTGAVCGVVHARGAAHGDVARLIPITTVFAVYPELRSHSQRAGGWLRLLDDAQLAASGSGYPGPRLRRFLEAVRSADDEHPYASLLPATPPLSSVYLRQQVSASSTEESAPKDADNVFHEHDGVQIIGGPGAGKSSLVRHIAATDAARWLDHGEGDAVPVPIRADALTAYSGLTEMLAAGVQGMLHTELDRPALSAMFASEPLPGVPWLVLVDGLDEILNPQSRDIVLAKVNRHRQDPRYRFAITTRPLHQLALSRVNDPERYPNYTIEPFDHEQLRQLAENWLRAFHIPDPAGTAARFLTRLKRTRLGELAAIPLIATMLCVLYSTNPDMDLPLNRAQLYQRFVDLLFAKHRTLRDLRGALREWVSRSGSSAEQAAEELLAAMPSVLGQFAMENQGLGDHRVEGLKFGTRVARWGQLRRPATLPEREWETVVAEVLRASGLLIEHPGGFRFLHQTIEEYLAAQAVVTRHPQASRRSARQWLAPQQRWPWQNLETRAFIAALWTDSGQDLSRILAKLLSRRHRRANLGFIVELERQRVALPDRVRRRLIDVLAAQLADPGLPHGEWATIARTLLSFDENRTVTSLEQILSERDVPSVRQLDAALHLSELRPGAAHSWLAKLAMDPAADKFDRLRAAKALLRVDQQSGATALAHLAGDTTMREMSVEAADLVNSTDPGRGLPLLQTIASNSLVQPHIRLRAARTLCRYDRNRGIAELVSLSRNRIRDPDVWYEAALAVEMWEPGGSTSQMIVIAEDRSVPSRIRVRAAAKAAEDDPAETIRPLIDIAGDRKAAPADRISAAELLAQLDPRSGLPMLLDLALARSMRPQAIAIAEAAGRYDKNRAADVLYQLSQRKDAADNDRLGAARSAARLSAETGATALRSLAQTTDVSRKARVDAASALAPMHPAEASALLADMVHVKSWPQDDQIYAVTTLCDIDPAHGLPELITLAENMVVSTKERIKLAKKVASQNPEAGRRLLRNIGRRLDGADPAVLEAARALEQYSPHQAKLLWQRLLDFSDPGTYIRERAVAGVRRLRSALPEDED